MTLLEAIPLVTSPLALIAFLAAAVVIAHGQAIGRAESLIKTAPEEDRKTLVAGALRILDVSGKSLSRAKQFELALEELHQRRMRTWMAFSASIFFGILFASLAAYSVYKDQTDPVKTVDALLTGPSKTAVMGQLHERGIYDAGDEDIVDFMIQKTSLTPAERQIVDESELIRRTSERYASVASVQELRRRAEEKIEPFRPVGQVITVTVPGDRDDQPKQFFVHVPFNSKFKWKTVRVTNPATNGFIRVLAKPAIDDTDAGTGLHLNSEQARFLNGGALIPAKIEMVVRETYEKILDPNCSWEHRSTQYLKLSHELCKQGKTVEVGYLINLLG